MKFITIIDKEMSESVQFEIKRRKEYMEIHGVRQFDFTRVYENSFTGRIICGDCGYAFGKRLGTLRMKI